MKKFGIIMVMAILAGSLLLAFDVNQQEQETIQQTIPFAKGGGAKVVKIDNIFGNIIVTGYAGDSVELSAVKTVKAKSADALAAGQSDVQLDIYEEGGTLNIIVDGPFRDDKGHVNWNDDFGYWVQVDFEVKVPFGASIDLKTINDGDIEVTDVDGDFQVRNVNGRIRLNGMAGSGTAHTVNGWVKVDFKRSPVKDCSFKTVNGDVRLAFPDTPDGDFMVKTFNGQIYSDFDATAIPVPAEKGERKSGKFVYKGNRFQGIRVGSGGPQIKMDTLNGDIIIAAR